MACLNFRRGLIQGLGLVLTVAFSVCVARPEQAGGILRGHVTDERGGIIIGTELTITDAVGTQRITRTNDEGDYSLSLAPGKYIVRAFASGFEPYENKNVAVAGGRSNVLDIKLAVAPIKEEVAVPPKTGLATDPDRNASAIVLKGHDLDALPDDPDQLLAALQALAGSSGGPDGGEIFLDGFTGGRIPSKGSIQEVRINQNPFSAEFDRLGFGRIDIITKAGARKFAGSTFFNFNDESLNSRNPFAVNRPPFQYRLYGGDLGGPILNKHSAFFIDLQRREIDDTAVIDAIILDPALRVASLNQLAPVLRRTTNLSPRFDSQLNDNNTLAVRYTYTNSRTNNLGVGDFSLQSRAYDLSGTQHTVQLTETAVVNKRMINEARFQYVREPQRLMARSSALSIVVLDSFVGGGASVGLSKSIRDRYEFGENITFAPGNHTLRAGMRLRGIRIDDISPNNYGGTFTFAGGVAPQLDLNNQVVVGANGQPSMVTITSIERYRRTLLFQQQGRSKAEIRALGGGPTQFSIAAGNPEARVNQIDLAGFIQDDWRMRSNFLLSVGLRYESQSNINSRWNLAPRIAFAWSPTVRGQVDSKTVLRGGFGIFYSRVSEDLSLQARRFDGFNQQQFVVTDPTIIDLLSATPNFGELANFAQAQSIRRLASDLRSPYAIQSAFSLERQLPFHLRLSAALINVRMLHVLRTRNVNAPVLATLGSDSSRAATRPLRDIGNVFQFESSGAFNQNQLVINVSGRLNQYLSLNAQYTLSKAKSDTDGVNTFPAYSYDLSTEYGRSIFDIRHRFFFSGFVSLPWNIRVSPLVVAASGRPFNIIIGRDSNGDTIFLERPAFATNLIKPGVIVTPLGAFDSDPSPSETIIPRNYGTGPGFFAVSLRVSKTIQFGSVGNKPSSPTGSGSSQQTDARNKQSPPRKSTENRYALTLSVQAWNLLNHANLNLPIGNLSSPFFG